MPPLLLLQKLPGKGDGGGGGGGGGGSVFASLFWLTRRSRVRWGGGGGGGNAFGVSYSTSNTFLLVARHILTTTLQKRL